MEKIIWTDRVRNEKVLLTVKGKRNIPQKWKEGKLEWSHFAYEPPSETCY